MKETCSFVFVLSVLISFPAFSQSGEELFKSNCSSCHSIGKGRVVGPDLSGVYNKMNNEWLVSFIKSSQSMVKSGDKDAVAIFNEYKIPMPDFNLTDQQISDIIAYIKQTDGAQPQAGGKAPAQAGTSMAGTADTTKPRGAPADTTKAQVAASDTTKGGTAGAAADTTSVTGKMVAFGNSLYYGYTRFLNGAAPCISCHNINDPSFLGGGKLAIDLSASYTKLGPQGITAILKNPPFPPMKAAVKGEITDQEAAAINSLLKSVSQESAYVKPVPSGMIFFVLGFVFALFMIVFTIIFYDERKIPERNYPA
jgi:mono/diheme cytochrome c family protein